MVADDHRHDAIGACGDPVVQTPVMDGLIGDGVCFRQNHIMGGLSGAVCVPTRACLLTGVNVFRAAMVEDGGKFRGSGEIDAALETLPEVFRRAGYRTFATGKWHNDRDSFHRGFEDGAKIFFGGMSDHLQVPVYDYDAEGKYPEEACYMGEKFSTDLFCDAAIDFLRGYGEEEPFFLYLAFTSPHDPRMAPREWAENYRPEDVVLPANFAPEHAFDNGEMRVRDEDLAPFPRTEEVVRRHIADYYAMIAHQDAHMGRVLEALEESGCGDDDTIVVYMADHGLAVGQHGLLGKQNMYDHSVRVPLIVRGPGLPRGVQVERLTYSYDVFPTLCELAGLEVPEMVEGPSLVGLAGGGVDEVRETVFSIYREIQRMVKDERWKLIRYYRDDAGEKGSERVQLFDLQEDPWEMNDLSEEPGCGEHLTWLAQAMQHWQESLHDPWKDRPVLP